MPPKTSSKQSLKHTLPKYKIYLFIGVFTLLLLGTFIYLNFYFQIKTIQIDGNIDKNKITSLENLVGTNLVFISAESLTDSLTKNNPALEVENIKKVYPNKLILNLTFVEPIAELKLNAGYALLSGSGKILEKIKLKQNKAAKSGKQLPVINFYQQFDYQQINLGNTLDYAEVLTSLLLLKKCLDLDLKVESIDISGSSMIVFNLNVPVGGEPVKKILFSAEKDGERQADELETLLIQFKIRSQDFKVLDLRFDKPVVKF